MCGDDKKTDFHWASFLLLNSLQTMHTTVVCTQGTAPTPPAALQATALDAPRLLQPTPWPTNCLLCRYFLKWRARHLSDQRSRLLFLEIGVQMSIRLNQLTKGKMNCIFFLEVNAYFHLSISSCNFNCSYLHRNIPVYKSAHSLQPYGLDSREMKLEAPCTPMPS